MSGRGLPQTRLWFRSAYVWVGLAPAPKCEFGVEILHAEF